MKYLIIFLMGLLPVSVFALEKPASELEEVGISPELGTQLDPAWEFTNSSGEQVTLGQYFIANKPLILIPAYYECPRLCGFLLNGAQELFNNLSLDLGKDYHVLTISFNPQDTSALAFGQQARFRSGITRPGSKPEDWNFLTGKEKEVRALMNALGFHYKKDGKEFAHSAALYVLTPDGRISQYFTGIDFSAWDVRLAVVEASMGAVGDAIDHVLLFCFRYDHLQGRYIWYAQNMMRAGGALTILFMCILFYRLRKREKQSV